MFTAGSTSIMREKVSEEFCKRNTKLHLTIANSTFGIGVDCPDITRTISWGLLPTLEELVQQSGRAEWDGSQSEAILNFWIYHHPCRHMEITTPGAEEIYCINTFFSAQILTIFCLVSVVIYVLHCAIVLTARSNYNYYYNWSITGHHHPLFPIHLCSGLHQQCAFLVSSGREKLQSSFDQTRHLAWGDVSVDCHTNPTMLKVCLKYSKTDQWGKGVVCNQKNQNCDSILIIAMGQLLMTL